jgi:hypothetical protein
MGDIVICSWCGVGAEYFGSGGNVCQFPFSAGDVPVVKPESPQTGWICPVCGAGNSPSSMQCSCHIKVTLGKL